jgi:hypothetical protein
MQIGYRGKSNKLRPMPPHLDAASWAGWRFKVFQRVLQSVHHNIEQKRPNTPNSEQVQGVAAEHRPNISSSGRWVAGQSGNPSGRPLAARQRISERLLSDLADVWEAHGKTVLARLAVDDPGKLAQIAYGLLPRDVFISVEQRAPGNLEPSEWATLRRVLDIIQACAPEGAEPGQVFETIETALRAEYAKPVST